MHSRARPATLDSVPWYRANQSTMDRVEMLIGTLAAAAEVNVETIRFCAIRRVRFILKAKNSASRWQRPEKSSPSG